MDKKVKLKNLTSWILTFKRINAVGDIMLPPNGVITLQNDEVMAQIYSGNKLFVGDDGKGAHARIFVDDEETRIEAEFENKEKGKKQEILTDEILKNILSAKSLSAFKKGVQEKIKTQSEKSKAVDFARKFKLNDHDKIEFLENYTGFKLRESK